MCNNNDDNDNNKFLQSFSKMFSKIKLSTFVKKAVLNTATLNACKTRQVLCNLFITNNENGSEMAFVTGATKVKFTKSENLAMMT